MSPLTHKLALKRDHIAKKVHSMTSSEGVSAWLLYTAVSVLIFFQIHVTVSDTTVNLNLADPFAVLTLSAVGLDALSKRRWPSWKVPGFNACLLAMWAVLILGLGWAWWLRGGVSGWAVSKVVGWIALLGYLAAGYLAVHYYGRLGFRRFVEIVVTVLCVVVLGAIVLTPLHGLGLLGFMPAPGTSGFEAYSGNRNALAFQLLVVMALYLPLLGQMRRVIGRTGRHSWLGIIALGILCGALFLTASRSALITFVLMLLVVTALRIAPWRTLFKGLLVGAALWGAVYWMPALLHALGSMFSGHALTDWDQISSQLVSPGRFSSESSDQGRVALLVASWDAWLRSPLFGNGLGSFLSDSLGILGFRVIIHNTLLWLLAEVGLVGAMPFVITFVLIIRSAWRQRSDLIRSHGLLLLMLVFAVMSQFQEVLYQRIFWLALGALVAMAPIREATGRPRPSHQLSQS